MAELRLKSTGTIKLFENDNTSSVTIASPASLGADRTVTLPDASVTLASGTMLATDGSGASLTALNASELGSGTVPTARLGSGTASSSTVLYGDQTYKAEPGGGKILQVVNSTYTTYVSTTATGTSFADTGGTIAITPSATSSKIMLTMSIPFYAYRSSSDSARFNWRIIRTISGDTTIAEGKQGWIYGSWDGGNAAERVFGYVWCYTMLDSPSTTSATTYKAQFVNYESGLLHIQAETAPANYVALEVDGS